MGKRNHQFKVQDLGRFLIYILAHRPDEFGLVPDMDGFVKIKELLRALHEEADWRFVRQAHINEVLLGKDRPLFETSENQIRAVERKWHLDLHTPAKEPPAILYIAVRKKAHPVVMEKGLTANANRVLVLSIDKPMALKIGKRRDPKPVVLEVMTRGKHKPRPLFYPFGDLFVSLQIPSQAIAGPPVAKEIMEQHSYNVTQKDRKETKDIDFSPGTFSLDMARDPDLHRKAKRKKRKGWKEDARALRKRKRH